MHTQDLHLLGQHPKARVHVVSIGCKAAARLPSLSCASQPAPCSRDAEAARCDCVDDLAHVFDSIWLNECQRPAVRMYQGDTG
jgi:hypothetical protein